MALEMANLKAAVDEAYRWFVLQPLHQFLLLTGTAPKKTEERPAAYLDVSRDFNALGVA
jgi:hypothetical protein